MSSFFRFDKNIKISYYFILISTCFYTYTFYANISKYYNFFFTLLTAIIYLTFHYYYKKKSHSLNFNLNTENILILAFIFFINFIFNLNDIFSSLQGDEFSNALRTQRTSIYGVYRIINYFDLSFLNEVQYKYIIHLFSFLFLIFFFIILYLISKKNIIVIFFLIIISVPFRYFLKDLGMHPPLNHAISFLFTSIFGFHEFLFRLSYIILYSLGLFFCYLQIRNLYSRVESFIFIVAIQSIPICFLSSTNVDHSLWGYVVLLNFLIYFYLNHKINYHLLSLLICLFSLARITNIILLIPLVLTYLYDKHEKINFKNLSKISLPIILITPILIKIFLSGSNVHSLDLPSTIFSTINMVINLELIKSASYFIPIYIIIFLVPGIILFFINEKVEKKILISFTFIIYFFIFSSISKNFIGHPKYIFEFISPFCIFLLFVLFQKIKYLKNFFCIILILLNISNFKYFENLIIKKDNFLSNFKIRERYNYNLAYNYILKNNLTNKTIFYGVYYGFVTEILNNYKLKDLIAVNKNNNSIKKFNTSDIDFIIVSNNIYNKQINQFKNWSIHKKFSYKNKLSTVYIIKKNHAKF